MIRRRPSDGESIESAFVSEMKAALKRREQAPTLDEKRRIEGQMQQIMRRHLVPRAVPINEARDGKLAAVGSE